MIKSIYRRAADNGFILGLFLSALFLLFVFSTKFALLSFLVLGFIFAIPGIIFYFLRKCFIQDFGTSTFSSLWMLGMLIFIFASLICGLVTYIYLQYIEPTFIYDQVRAALTIYNQIEGASTTELVKVLQAALDQKLLPTPIQFTFQMIWMTSFFGSILSMFTSLIVKSFKIRNKN